MTHVAFKFSTKTMVKHVRTSFSLVFQGGARESAERWECRLPPKALQWFLLAETNKRLLRLLWRYRFLDSFSCATITFWQFPLIRKFTTIPLPENAQSGRLYCRTKQGMWMCLLWKLTCRSWSLSKALRRQS